MNAQLSETNDSNIIPVTKIVAEWVATLVTQHIPKEPLAHARRALLDGLGCGIFGSQQKWCRIATLVTQENSADGPCTIWGTNKKAGPIDAAMANGTAIHGFEIDDLHVESMLHPGAVILPGVLALAEARGLSGEDILRGMVAGYEISIRTAICSSIQHKLRGYHMTATNGTIGAAAAAAATLGLNVEQTNDAIGLSVSFASGLYSARKGAMTKRLHAGLAARSGVLAGLLAEKGFTGAKDGLEVDYGGYFSTMSEDTDLSIMTENLGKYWHINDNGFKAYASCGSTHTTVDCIRELMNDGLSSKNLKNLTINISKAGFTNIGWDYFPGGVVGMQMNGRFVAATALLKGDVFVDQFNENRMEDAATLELMKKIDFVHDPKIDALGLAKRHTVKLRATRVDGKIMEATREQRTGSSQYPLTDEQLEKKFRTTTEGVISKTAADKIVNLVNSIDTLSNAEDLTVRLAI